jgi:hypothetical protein
MDGVYGETADGLLGGCGELRISSIKRGKEDWVLKGYFSFLNVLGVDELILKGMRT